MSGLPGEAEKTFFHMRLHVGALGIARRLFAKLAKLNSSKEIELMNTKTAKQFSLPVPVVATYYGLFKTPKIPEQVDLRRVSIDEIKTGPIIV